MHEGLACFHSSAVAVKKRTGQKSVVHFFFHLFSPFFLPCASARSAAIDLLWSPVIIVSLAGTCTEFHAVLHLLVMAVKLGSQWDPSIT